MITRRQFIQSASLLTLPSLVWSAKGTVFDTQVAIVGSGPAGLSLAHNLAKSGIKVLVIESGPLNGYDPKAQERNKVLDAGQGLPYPLGWATKRMLGGTSTVWGGHTPRFQPDDLLCKSKFDYAADWPISYQEMEKYYCDAEKFLQIFNPFDSCSAFPLKDNSFNLATQLNKSGFKNSAAASVTTNNKGQYQPLRLKHSQIPGLIKNKNFSIAQNLTARNVEVSKNGEITSLLCSTNDHQTIKINCQKLVLCAGAIQSARLLMMFNQQNNNIELGSNGGQLGANFMDHPAVRMSAYASKSFTVKHGPAFGQAHIWHWYGKQRKQGIGAFLPMIVQRNSIEKEKGKTLLEVGSICEQEPLKGNRFELSVTEKDEFGDPLPKCWYQLSSFDKRTAQSATTNLKQVINESKYFELIEEKPVRWGSHHLMGTTRMANQDKDGVVDVNLKVFGSKNLYILGGSVFPSGGAANPTLSIVALGIRLAKHLKNIA